MSKEKEEVSAFAYGTEESDAIIKNTINQN